MNKDYFLKNYGKTNPILVAMSLAATWIWAPAIYVSSGISAQWGILGLIYFLIPNILTLIIFGYYANKVRNKLDGFTFLEYIKLKTNNKQYYLHLISSIILLICSTSVQLIGLKVLCQTLFTNINVYIILISLMIIILIYTILGGIKFSIYTDTIKYIIMVICLIPLLFKIDYSLLIKPYVIDNVMLFKTYGLASTINLLLASFLDQTFWQRVFSSKAKDIIKIGWLSGLFFGIIPLILGLVGLTQFQNNSFNIVHYFNYYPFNILMIVIIGCTLVSTIDSNLSALSSIIWNEFDFIKENKKYLFSIIGMILLTIMSLFISSFSISITTFFLIYGTIRTCTGVPSILIITNKFNEKRLWYSTLITVIICNIGYIYFSFMNKQYTYIFTILAVLLPLFGWSNNYEN